MLEPLRVSRQVEEAHEEDPQVGVLEGNGQLVVTWVASRVHTDGVLSGALPGYCWGNLVGQARERPPEGGRHDLNPFSEMASLPGSELLLTQPRPRDPDPSQIPP
jgi:hypothetical protein